MTTTARTPTDSLPREGSGAMFDAIAARYDLVNRLISLGIDQSWRRATSRALALPENARVLDIATGTADLAIRIAEDAPSAHVVGLDPSERMLAVGRAKIERAGLSARIELCTGDAQALPMADDSFDGTCIAFGIRNVPDRAKALAEMARVTRPGGRIAILELSEPRGTLIGSLARFHVHTVVPWIGSLLSGAREYRYLQRSIAAFPPAEEFAELMRASGVTPLEVRPLTFGVCHLYVGTPARA
ncbi:MAG: bifunctional demethylmenaquinone methyltransferase/2-methoxy-6-polyprenyl-1,4-benzoquinol methylase UbiE [Pseudomonadota bacterium]|nr:MAG: bifunctional demethylmenaquinone methyltransferase/2-methoxy-6-polyprenyl-1,4-benzoquinol methylase UbiE [Pseudomonadota bacterium]